MTPPVRLIRGPALVLLAVAVMTPAPSTQGLTYDLFARYLAPLREQAGIPGLSAAIAQNGRVVWEQGYGLANVESSLPARGDTLYPIGDLAQTIGSTILLSRCVEGGEFELDDRVQRWHPSYREQFTTFRELLSHRLSEGAYSYNPSRFAELTPAIEECADTSYPELIAADVLSRLGMADSIPGMDSASNSASAREQFSASARARYESLMERVAMPYRVDGKGKALRSTYLDSSLTAANGLVTTVEDLARFDAALNDGIFLSTGMRSTAWTRSQSSPMGLGWFVQFHNGRRVVWHFGLVRDAYSSLIIKIPEQGLTLILLANSDGLSRSFPLTNGDVTVSPFAKVFLGFIG